MDEGNCFQPGCKLCEWTRDSDGKLSTAGTPQEVLPAAIDHEGQEVSLEVYLGLKYPHDAKLRAKAKQDTYHGQDYQLACEYVDWYRTKVPSKTKRAEHTYNFLEHIAGPSCVDHNGYSGHDISAEEMKYCTTMLHHHAVHCAIPQ